MLPNGRAGPTVASPSGGQSNYDGEEVVWLRHSEADTRGQKYGHSAATTATSGGTKRV